MNESHRQSIPLEHLSVGMFVVELDVPWINSPFITHSRKIKSFKDIDALRRSGVKNLVIDLERGVPPKTARLADGETSIEPLIQDIKIQDAVQAELALENTDKNTDSLVSAGKSNKPQNIASEMAAAEKVSFRVKEVANEFFNALENKKPLDVQLVDPLVEQTIDSLSRNNQALMSLVNLTRKAPKLADHAFSTFCIAINIGLLLKFSSEDLKVLGLACLLHEAGWQQIPLNLMGKRKRYTANEEALVERHVEIGMGLLKSAQIPDLAYRLIAEHHERCNGSGYPKQLTDDQIHPLSKILAIADSYDESIHQLQDKPGVLPRIALQQLYKLTKNGIYDTRAMTAFISMMGVYPVTSAVLLETGEKAVVIENDQLLHTTRIKIFYDKNGKSLEFPLEVVLPDEEEPQRVIKSLIDAADSRLDPFGLLEYRLP